MVDLFTKAVKPQVVEFSVPKLGPTPYLLPFVDFQESVKCALFYCGPNLLSHVQQPRAARRFISDETG